jgi:hypothetical protein
MGRPEGRPFSFTDQCVAPAAALRARSHSLPNQPIVAIFLGADYHHSE